MKVRKGFVSNSSSTSFVVLLPKDFKPSTEAIKNVIYEYNKENKISIKAVHEIFEFLLNNKICHESDYGDAVIILSKVLKEYVIFEMDSGPEDCKITLADYDKASKIVQIEINK